MMLEVLFEDERSVMARARNVAFIGWRNAPLVPHVREWHRIGRAIAKEFPGEGACIDIVVRGTPNFSDEVRKEAQRLASDPKIFERGFSHVLLIPGLAGAAVRAFINTILLVTRPPAPAKVFGDVSSAVAWLQPKLAQGAWDAAALSRGCDDLVTMLA